MLTVKKIVFGKNIITNRMRAWYGGVCLLLYRLEAFLNGKLASRFVQAGTIAEDSAVGLDNKGDANA